MVISSDGAFENNCVVAVFDIDKELSLLDFL